MELKFVKVIIKNREPFWFSENLITIDASEAPIEKIINDPNLVKIYNWKFKSEFYGNNKLEKYITTKLVQKYGLNNILDLKRNDEISLEIYNRTPTMIDIGDIRIENFKIQTKNASYLINKDYTLKDLSNCNSNDLDLVENDYTWINNDFSLTGESSYFSSNGSSPRIEQTKNVLKIFDKAIKKNNIPINDIQICTKFLNVNVKNILDINVPTNTKNGTHRYTYLSPIDNGGLRIFETINFEDFMDNYKEDWKPTIETLADGTTVETKNLSYSHSWYGLSASKNGISEFEGYLIKVYEYFQFIGIVRDPAYITGNDEINYFSEIAYTSIKEKNFIYDYIKTIFDKVKIGFEKNNFKFDINKIIRDFYGKDKSPKKVYFKAFVDWYFITYIKPDIDAENVDITKKYKITPSNLSKILMTII